MDHPRKGTAVSEVELWASPLRSATWLLVVCLCGHLTTTSASAGRIEIRLGGLFPLFRVRYDPLGEPEYTPDKGGSHRMEAFLMAVEEVNANASFWSLGGQSYNVTVSVILGDSRRDSTQVVELLYPLVHSSFCENSVCEGVHGIVGPASSPPVKAVHNWLSDDGLQVPQIAYSATSPVLSQLTHFARTPPSDSAVTSAQSELLALFNWKRLVVIHSTDIYGDSGRILVEEARKGGITARAVVHPEDEEIDWSVSAVKAHDAMKEISGYILALWGGSKEIAKAIATFFENGWYDGILFFPSDTFQFEDLVGLIGKENATLVLQGSLLLFPSYGKGTKEFDEAQQRWTGRESSITPEGKCSNRTDDDRPIPGSIYNQDLGGKVGKTCVEIEASGSTWQKYVAFTYDATYALFFAFRATLAKYPEGPCVKEVYYGGSTAGQPGPGRKCSTGDDVFQELLRVDFQGVTGRIGFQEDGDRSEKGMKYNLYQFSENLTLTRVGIVSLRDTLYYPNDTHGELGAMPMENALGWSWPRNLRGSKSPIGLPLFCDCEVEVEKPRAKTSTGGVIALIVGVAVVVIAIVWNWCIPAARGKELFEQPAPTVVLPPLVLGRPDPDPAERPSDGESGTIVLPGEEGVIMTPQDKTSPFTNFKIVPMSTQRMQSNARRASFGWEGPAPLPMDRSDTPEHLTRKTSLASSDQHRGESGILLCESDEKIDLADMGCEGTGKILSTANLAYKGP